MSNYPRWRCWISGKLGAPRSPWDCSSKKKKKSESAFKQHGIIVNIILHQSNYHHSPMKCFVNFQCHNMTLAYARVKSKQHDHK